jgi:SulP family sulfate permease
VSPGRGLLYRRDRRLIVSLLGAAGFIGDLPARSSCWWLTVERHGIDGVILATSIAGVFLLPRASAARHHIKSFLSGDGGFTPDRCHNLRQPVRISGITLTTKEPGELILKLEVLAGGRIPPRFQRLPCRRQHAIIVVLRKPAALARHSDRGRCRGARHMGAVVAGGNHRHPLRRHSREVPWPAWPLFSLEKAGGATDAIAFALLGAIESRLGRSGRWHDRPGIAPIANWCARVSPISDRRCSAVSVSPAPSRDRD